MKILQEQINKLFEKLGYLPKASFKAPPSTDLSPSLGFQLVSQYGEIENLQYQLKTTQESFDHFVTVAQHEMDEIRAKYPVVWFKGNVAQGVVQLKKLKLAAEFFREGNRLCIILPFADAAGKKPQDLIPEFLEVDDTLEVECQMDTMDGKKQINPDTLREFVDRRVVIYKIPIRGWDDTITLDRKLEEDHPSYGLNGTPIDKVKTFRNSGNVNGMFKREADSANNLYCHVWYFEQELPLPFHENMQALLPKGNLLYDRSRAEKVMHDWSGHKPNRMFHWRIPVTEAEMKMLFEVMPQRQLPKSLPISNILDT